MPPNVPAGILVDIIGQKALLMGLALLATGVPYFLVGVSHSFCWVAFFMAFVGVGIAGSISDRSGRKRVVTAGLFSTSIVLFVLAYFQMTCYSLRVWRFLVSFYMRSGLSSGPGYSISVPRSWARAW